MGNQLSASDHPFVIYKRADAKLLRILEKGVPRFMKNGEKPDGVPNFSHIKCPAAGFTIPDKLRLVQE